MNHVEYFYRTGQLLDGMYYFVPALGGQEILTLHRILEKVKGSKVILHPLSYNQITGSYNNGQNLLWLEVSGNEIDGWQNIDQVTEDGVSYMLQDLASIKKYRRNNDYGGPLRDGRLFLAELPNTEDIFNQLNESEEDFDWVPELTDPSTLKDINLVNFLNQYFETTGYDYRSEYDGNYYSVYDETGYYVTIPNNKTFTLKTLERAIINSIEGMKFRDTFFNRSHNDETIQQYQELYQVLTPLFEMT